MKSRCFAVLLLGLGIAASGCKSSARVAAPRAESVEVLPQWDEFVQKNYQDEVRSRLNTAGVVEFLHSPSGSGCLYYPEQDYSSLFTVVPVIAPNPVGHRIRQDMVIRWWTPGNAKGDPNAPWKSDRGGIPPVEERKWEGGRS